MFANGAEPGSVPVTLLFTSLGVNTMEAVFRGSSKLDCCNRSSAFAAVRLGGQLVAAGTLSQTWPEGVSLVVLTLPSMGADMLPLPVNFDCLGSMVSFSKHTVAASALCKLTHRPASSSNTAARECDSIATVGALTQLLVCCTLLLLSKEGEVE